MAYEIRVERERALDAVTLEEWFDLKAGKMRVVVQVMERFVWDTEAEGYVEAETAHAVLGKFSFRMLQEATPKMLSGILSVLVPPKNGGGSG